ncbi:Hypothetical_protein [Hexamita inflata]|uniref:Hypothetical_protein n=1 Tax=Hexamita inflata TaxID=28002 RepID=A0AA86NA88_9EUKA|nr:Hypothetical protein HINF_LOCUS3325 [Hexamita inflata]
MQRKLNQYKRQQSGIHYILYIIYKHTTKYITDHQNFPKFEKLCCVVLYRYSVTKPKKEQMKLEKQLKMSTLKVLRKITSCGHIKTPETNVGTLFKIDIWVLRTTILLIYVVCKHKSCQRRLFLYIHSTSIFYCIPWFIFTWNIIIIVRLFSVI